MKLDVIELDTSIQCRATIDTALVNEYAELMETGADFPQIEVYGTRAKCWIGDGWHRVLAARQRGAEEIDAKVHLGGRVEALKHALGANTMHGHRRSNADKRRSVEIALREFPKLSSRAVAGLCGVGKDMVEARRPAPAENASATRTTTDGREHPAHPARREEPAFREPVTAEVHVGERETPVLGPPCVGMQYARMALMDLEQIREDDAERAAAFACVREWLDARES